MLPPAFRRVGRPALLGHRGASADRPENTREALELALEQGADGVELDVLRCASGEVVVVHDEVLTRLAGLPWRVGETPWRELRDLDVGSHFDPAFAHARLVLLAELLATLPREALINIELKGNHLPDFGLPRAVARLLAEDPAPGRFLVSSFHPLLIGAFQREATGIATALLFAADRRGFVQQAGFARLLKPEALNPSLHSCSAAALRGWKARRFGLCVWTVDEPAVAIALHRTGVDCLISNVPGQILRGFAE